MVSQKMFILAQRTVQELYLPAYFISSIIKHMSIKPGIEISFYHGDEYKDGCPFGCYAMYSGKY
jgi:hypothetical protein